MDTGEMGGFFNSSQEQRASLPRLTI